MRHIITMAFCLCVAASVYAVHPPGKFRTGTEQETFLNEESVFSQLTFRELISLRPREIRAKTGRKLKFREWLGIRILKAKSRKSASETHKEYTRGDMKVDYVSIASLMCSLIGVSLFLLLGTIGLWIIFLFGIAGLTLGLIAIFSSRRYQKRRGERLAFAGIVLGIAAVLGAFGVIALKDFKLQELFSDLFGA